MESDNIDNLQDDDSEESEQPLRDKHGRVVAREYSTTLRHESIDMTSDLSGFENEEGDDDDEYKANIKKMTAWRPETWDGQISIYNTERIHSWFACCLCRGTACEDKVIWTGEFIIFLVYIMSVAILLIVVKTSKDPKTAIPFFVAKEGSTQPEVFEVKAIAEYVKVFVAFFLGLYLSLNVTRWWQLRVSGINPIFDATTHAVTILSAFDLKKSAQKVARYGRLSLQLVFNWHEGAEDMTKGEAREVFKRLQKRGVLQPDEMRVFMDDLTKDLDVNAPDNSKVNSNFPRMAEVVWTWIMFILLRRQQERKLGSVAMHYLLGICRQGQQACNSVRHQLTTQLPMPYVHIITFLVKTHNVILAVSAGLMTVYYFEQDSSLAAVSEMIRVLLISWLYNSVLAICSMMADPFGNDRIDFPRRRIDQELMQSALSIMFFGQKDNMPFLKDREMADLAEGTATQMLADRPSMTSLLMPVSAATSMETTTEATPTARPAGRKKLE